MKFLCDRCKTRYSIGDERVRGKILKIRCKNCANVITVREGMAPDLDAGPEQPTRPKKSTTNAPEGVTERAEPRAADLARSVRTAAQPAAQIPSVDRPPRNEASRVARVAQAAQVRRTPLDEARTTRAEPSRAEPAPAAPSALGAAFASAMTKPPPALDEEWYVSIDGEQSGPFSLAEAQQWVAHKPFDAELYCWSEGFDDWLPVDKVSHFRGLRKRPAPAPAPPPVPRVGGAGGVAPRAAIAAKPSGPVTPVPAPARAIEDDPKPLFAATMASLERGAPVAAQPAPQPAPARATPPFGTAIPPRSNGASPARQPAAAPADTFDVSESGDSKTEIEPIPFRDPVLRDPPASATLQGTGANPAITAPAVSEAASDFGAFDDFGDDDDGLAIGEVSRVVKLGDIVKSRGQPRRATTVGGAGRTTGGEAMIGAARPSMRSTGAIASLADVQPGAPPPEGDPALTMAPVAKSHRRGLITLLSVAGVLVLGVIGAVVVFVTTESDPTGGHLGQVRDIDTSRPEDPITHRPIEPTQPAPNPFIPPRPHPRVPTPTPTPGSGRDTAPAPTGDSLNPEEIEEVARKHQDTTQRCYLRSQRGADSILVGDVKKIAVTLTIDGDGSVSDVKLSEHGADSLGKCLITFMRGWKFRPSPGGQFRFSLNFVGG